MRPDYVIPLEILLAADDNCSSVCAYGYQRIIQSKLIITSMHKREKTIIYFEPCYLCGNHA